ncbi:MAG: molybdate ABC transporter substrate-binding protein [Chloroflexi bacterium]|nr:molybdate ABC transporter substrate-binding protein [Chloroflexota bacterium]
MPHSARRSGRAFHESAPCHAEAHWAEAFPRPEQGVLTASTRSLPSLLSLLFSLLSLLAACAAPSAPQSAGLPTAATPRTLTVFAASSLLDAFTDLGKAYEAAHPGVTVAFNFDGSASLRAQFEQGAVADVFASANQKEMDTVAAAGLVVSGAAKPFASNVLVVILPADNPGNVQTLADLARPGLRLTLAAEVVPVGSYSRQALEKLNARYGASFKEGVLANVVSDESNVKQIVAKVNLGEADAGIVYATDARAALTLITLAIPAEYNVTARYPMAALSAAPNPTLAADFVAFVLSPAGQTILQKWGFLPVTP